MRSTPPLVDEQFGRWTVTGESFMKSPGHRAVPCRCSCGAEQDVLVFQLRNGRSSSCGCLKREQVASLVSRTRSEDSHGLAKHPLYRTWRGMMRRCYDEADPHYPRWGGRGIRVCREWHDVRVFVAWVEANLGERPPGRTLDREDNDGPYAPGKVRWATPLEQYENSRLLRDLSTGRFLSPGS